MSQPAIAVRPSVRTSIRSLLTIALYSILAIHAVLLLPWWHPGIGVSRFLTAAAPAMAALCVAWRAQEVTPRERAAWRWLGLAMLFWSAGQVVEAFIGQSNAASNLAVDASDFFYVSAAFPLLLAISSTKETESIRAVALLDFVQVSLALGLTWELLFRTALPAGLASTAMLRVYVVECLLLAVGAILRLATWSTLEERRRVRLMCAVLWLYVPVELGMDYATRSWGLQSGTILDLLWSVPFVFGGWLALRMPMDENPAQAARPLNRGKLLAESLCPLLFTLGVFALACSITMEHEGLALAAIFILLLVQGLHAGLVQLNFLSGKRLLLAREQELETANTMLQQLSMLDPLTGIPNRRRFTGVLVEAWKRAIRTRESVAVLMVDADFFKGVNDLHGHTYGDECLKAIARALGQAGRSNDLLARHGGEEFVLLLPETNASGAMKVAERVRQAVAAMAMRNDASPFNKLLTVSVGVGVTSPRLGMNSADLVDIADQALYEAKHRGRNMICLRTLEPAQAALEAGLSGLS
jgi:diguanylate cyclase (GGDEF)-like protein